MPADQPIRQTLLLLLLAAVCGALVVMLGMTIAAVSLPHWLLPAVLLPVVAWRIARAWRGCVDPAALRAAETLGVGRWRRWSQLVLPDFARALVSDILVAGIVAAATVLVVAFSRGWVGPYTRAP